MPRNHPLGLVPLALAACGAAPPAPGALLPGSAVQAQATCTVENLRSGTPAVQVGTIRALYNRSFTVTRSDNGKTLTGQLWTYCKSVERDVVSAYLVVSRADYANFLGVFTSNQSILSADGLTLYAQARVNVDRTGRIDVEASQTTGQLSVSAGELTLENGKLSSEFGGNLLTLAGNSVRVPGATLSAPWAAVRDRR